MYLKSIAIHGVRNLADTHLTLNPSVNYIYGENGAGKTALLEAVYLLSRGRSFRSHKIATLISHGKDELMVRGEVCREQGPDIKLGLAKRKDGHTQIRIGGERERRVSALARELPLQILLPDAARLVLSGPSERRAFIDWGLFHVEPGFLDTYSQYRRVLAQRNAWLKTVAVQAPDPAADPWAPQLLAHGVALHTMRLNYVEALQPYISAGLERLGIDAQISIEYASGGLGDAEEAEKRLVESLPRDVKLGTTHRGPHRSDLLIKADTQPASDVLSRGQAKLVAGACILAQAEYLRSKRDIRCLFLVDDFAAELDPVRWRVFLEKLVHLNGQVIVTSTRLDGFAPVAAEYGVREPLDTIEPARELEAGSGGELLTPNEYKVFHVEHGKLTPFDSIPPQ